MVSCCRCTLNRRCRTCICHQNGRDCTNCLPGEQGRCSNDKNRQSATSIQDPIDHAVIGLVTEDNLINNETSVTGEIAISRRDMCTEASNENIRDLPQYTPLEAPNFLWDEIDGKSFGHSIDCCYTEITHWKRNLFKIPSGKTGKSFVRELSCLFTAYANSSALESIALKASMVMPALLLQKPHQKSKAKEHCIHLDRRLQLWSKGEINALVLEGRVIQRQFNQASRNNETQSDGQTARKFAKLMTEGKVRGALRLIAEDETGGVLPLDDNLLKVLMDKHPTKQPPHASTIIDLESLYSIRAGRWPVDTTNSPKYRWGRRTTRARCCSLETSLFLLW